jgi:hypothetical protein
VSRLAPARRHASARSTSSHEVGVDRWRGGLQQVDVVPLLPLVDPYVQLAVREAVEGSGGQADAQPGGERFGERGVGRPRDQRQAHEVVPCNGSASSEPGSESAGTPLVGAPGKQELNGGYGVLRAASGNLGGNGRGRGQWASPRYTRR